MRAPVGGVFLGGGSTVYRGEMESGETKSLFVPTVPVSFGTGVILLYIDNNLVRSIPVSWKIIEGSNHLEKFLYPE